MAELIPHISGALNAVIAVFLVAGFRAIRRGDEVRHPRWMLAALGVGIVFIAVYGAQTQIAPYGRFPGDDWVRALFVVVLLTHTALAVVIVPLIVATVVLARRGERERHRRLARVTFPLWFYVAVTGVVIYVMNNHVRPHGATPDNEVSAAVTEQADAVNAADERPVFREPTEEERTLEWLAGGWHRTSEDGFSSVSWDIGLDGRIEIRSRSRRTRERLLVDYTLEGSEISLTFPDGTTENWSASVEGGELLLQRYGAARLWFSRVPSRRPPLRHQSDWRDIFAAHDVHGTAVVLDVDSGAWLTFDPVRARRRLRPASTFKILSAACAIDTGVVTDIDATRPWDGTTHHVDAWNQDTSLRGAMSVSTVWFFQELARELGSDRLRTCINSVGYGNRDIGDENNIDRFWLDGPLEISAIEQVEFVHRLFAGETRFGATTVATVLDILPSEEIPCGDAVCTLRAKTGFMNTTDPMLGWWVGAVFRDDAPRWVFAVNLDMESARQAPVRQQLGRDILAAVLGG